MLRRGGREPKLHHQKGGSGGRVLYLNPTCQGTDPYPLSTAGRSSDHLSLVYLHNSPSSPFHLRFLPTKTTGQDKCVRERKKERVYRKASHASASRHQVSYSPTPPPKGTQQVKCLVRMRLPLRISFSPPHPPPPSAPHSPGPSGTGTCPTLRRRSSGPPAS